MKRHHVVMVCVFVFGGLFAYIQLHHGDTDRAIRTSIISILIAGVVLLYKKLRTWLEPVGVTVPLIIIGLMAAHAVFTGDFAAAIFLSIGLIGISVGHFLQDTPFFKKNRTLGWDNHLADPDALPSL